MIRLLLLLLLFACSKDMTNNESITWVENLSIDRILKIDDSDTLEDESMNELYIQVELSGQANIDEVDSLIVELEYIGSGNLEYNETFRLYDNGYNGDIIANNGVYTLIDLADKVKIPDDDLQITSIGFPDYIEVHPVDIVSVGYSVLVKGKKYLSTVKIFTKTGIITYSEYINLDNTRITIEKNNSELYNYDSNPLDDECGWELSPNPPPSDFFDTIKDMDGNPIVLPNAKQSGDDYFVYEDSLSVYPLSLCQPTGTLIFRFILISENGDSTEETYKDKTFVLYGCGDRICTENYENISLCPEDCNDE